MSSIIKSFRRIMINNNISQKVLTSSIFVFFSGFLIFLDSGGFFMYGIPNELIVPIYITQRNKYAYILGMIIAVFVALTYRDATTIARIIPILQYFLAFFSLLAYREIKESKLGKKFRD